MPTSIVFLILGLVLLYFGDLSVEMRHEEHLTDELPQFWNVLKGEISLVGPSPERPELIAGFKHEIPHYNARHTVKPGLTGWAQIHRLRGDTDLGERIRCIRMALSHAGREVE